MYWPINKINIFIFLSFFIALTFGCSSKFEELQRHFIIDSDFTEKITINSHSFTWSVFITFISGWISFFYKSYVIKSNVKTFRFGCLKYKTIQLKTSPAALEN